MLTVRHNIIKAFVILAFCFSSTSLAWAQDSTETKAREAHASLTSSAKETEKWAQDKINQTKNQAVLAHKKVQAVQRKALPLKRKIESKLPKGNVPGENMFNTVMKKTSAPAIFVFLAFAFAVWVFCFATSPGRD